MNCRYVRPYGTVWNKKMVPEVGLEPTLCCQNWILNPARLPISPLRQDLRGAKYIFADRPRPVFHLHVLFPDGFQPEIGSVSHISLK